MSASLTPSPKMQFFDANGDPLVGGKLYTYAAGTTTPLSTYTDSTGGTPNANPVVMNARGEASVWLGTSAYYFELKDSAGSLIWTADNITGQITPALVQSGTYQWLTSVSGSDTITAVASPVPSAYAAGQTFRFVSAGANTGAATLNISGLGAKSITKNGTTALVAGDIPSGAVAEVTYDGTQFQLINVKAASPSGSITTSGYTQNTSKILGRTTASAGAIEEISVGSGLTLTGGTLDVASASASIVGAFRNLQAAAAGTGANVTVTADEIVVENSSNAYQTLRAVSLTINTAGSGANGLDTGSLTGSTWYSEWVIAKADGTTAGLISSSATAPTLPAGYTYKARIGWIRTDGTANKYPLCFKQSGRTTTYKVAGGSNLTALPAMASGVLGNVSTPTWSAVAWANFAPSTAAVIHVVVSTPQNGTAMIAPNSSYGAFNSTSNPPLVVSSIPNTGGLWDNKQALIPLESSDIYVASLSGGMYLYALGWEDNL